MSQQIIQFLLIKLYEDVGGTGLSPDSHKTSTSGMGAVSSLATVCHIKVEEIDKNEDKTGPVLIWFSLGKK